MPAKSRAQQQAFGIARGIQKGEIPAKAGTPSADIAKSAEPGDVEKFAATKHKGLPAHAPKEEGTSMTRLRELVRGQVEQAVFERRFVEGLRAGVKSGEMHEAGDTPGSGGFKGLVRSLAAQEGIEEICRHDFKEMAEQKIRDPKALAAFIGRKKFGKEKFQKMAAKGREE